MVNVPEVQLENALDEEGPVAGGGEGSVTGVFALVVGVASVWESFAWFSAAKIKLIFVLVGGG